MLQIENLSKRFGGIVASDNITLNVSEGELHAISDHVGPIFDRADEVWGRCESVLDRMTSGLA